MSKQKIGSAVFSGAIPAAANFAAEKPKKKRKPTDHLEYDVMQAEALGYGCHYGAYKADHQETRADFEADTGMVEVKKVDTSKVEKKCLHCGGVFYTSGLASKKVYCCDECRLKANAEREAARQKQTNPTCQWCGGAIPPNKWRTVYCCPECYAASKRAKARRRREAKNGV